MGDRVTRKMKFSHFFIVFGIVGAKEGEKRKSLAEHLTPLTKGHVIEFNYPDDPKSLHNNFSAHEHFRK